MLTKLCVRCFITLKDGLLSISEGIIFINILQNNAVIYKMFMLNKTYVGSKAIFLRRTEKNSFTSIFCVTTIMWQHVFLRWRFLPLLWSNVERVLILAASSAIRLKHAYNAGITFLAITSSSVWSSLSNVQVWGQDVWNLFFLFDFYQVLWI